MSCNCNEDHHHHDCDFNCVSNVVRFIHELQECATTTCGSGCEVPFLGAHNTASVANTRPFILYTKTGGLFEAFAPSASLTSCQSPIFRVESIDDDDCAVLRVLTVVLGDGSPATEDPVCTFLAVQNARLVSTSACLTVDLSCFCAIQCLRDVTI
ncbi:MULTISPECIES: spore coat protein CotY [Bacillus cereus group]|uniref:spore coat protein CotY n=1 Tax=Bacillus cereus group TaxID=86661 RepID=UPI0001A0A55C|nr:MULTISPECIES: spore coat protein CotY [Bacillus cereus group]EEL46769.1 Spore coat protein [Bacillus cereus Rock3-42]MDA1523625.1 CotY/CotZ family spore coat protein [Bacillus cereus]MDA2309453.1 CotY/CotZ family spore coat protein [Bacillus cereus]MDA2316717.1 CotY/CotZ family spore coat protein [Bacillus cereus]MDA2498367.1 CotY/CotZ family spore coat protein [Bacillus cereus]